MCSKLYKYMYTCTKAYINTSIYIYICEKRVGGTTARARTGGIAIKVFKWRFKWLYQNNFVVVVKTLWNITPMVELIVSVWI